MVDIKGHYLKGAGGINLFVEERGNENGIPIVFIHGYSQSRFSWMKQLRSELLSEFRLLAIDNRGHGSSDKPFDQYNDSKLWAFDMATILEQLKVQKPVLVGWSYGGLIICDYLRFYGEEKIRGINLVGARTRIGVPEALIETGESYIELKKKLVSNDTEISISALEEFLSLCTYKEISLEEFYFFLGFNAKVPPYVRKGLMDRKIKNEDILASLQTPVLITQGVEDQIVLRNHAEYNASLLKNKTVSYYEKSGHMPFWENEGRYNSELHQFVHSLKE